MLLCTGGTEKVHDFFGRENVTFVQSMYFKKTFLIVPSVFTDVEMKSVRKNIEGSLPESLISFFANFTGEAFQTFTKLLKETIKT